MGVKGTIEAELAALEAIPVKSNEKPAIPDDIDTWELVRGIARGKYVVSSQQMKALEMELDRLRPKVSAVAVGHFDTDGFASMLDKAIARAAPAKLIELKPEEPINTPEPHSAEELKGPMPKLRRY